MYAPGHGQSQLWVVAGGPPPQPNESRAQARHAGRAGSRP